MKCVGKKVLYQSNKKFSEYVFCSDMPSPPQIRKKILTYVRGPPRGSTIKKVDYQVTQIGYLNLDLKTPGPLKKSEIGSNRSLRAKKMFFL